MAFALPVAAASLGGVRSSCSKIRSKLLRPQRLVQGAILLESDRKKYTYGSIMATPVISNGIIFICTADAQYSLPKT